MTAFSRRLPPRYDENPLLAAVETLRRDGALLDLTDANPTAVGIASPQAAILAAYQNAEILRYTPSSEGLESARTAIAQYYAARGYAASPDQFFITASTSDSYHYLFKLLTDPGDAILVPEPSYPLFDALLSLEHVAKRPYYFRYLKGEWRVDVASLHRALATDADRIKALVIVNPNNPTGAYLHPADWEIVVNICADHHLAFICDEVFWDYPLNPVPRHSSITEPRVLTFTLNGISKLGGLPQLKLGWMGISGPADEVGVAKAHLDFISDCYLSVSTPVQVALPQLLALTPHLAIAERVRANLTTLQSLISHSTALELPTLDGGWCAPIRLCNGQADDEVCLRVLKQEHVWLYPGYFFDFPDGDWLVVSLLPEPARFKAGIHALLRCV